MKNILITSAGKRVVLTQIFQQTAKELGLDSKVYTVDNKPKMSPACIVSDGGFEVPLCTDNSYLENLIKLCKEQNVGIVIPTIDTELLVLAKNKNLFDAAGVFLLLPELDFVKIWSIVPVKEAFIKTPKNVDKYHPVFPMFAKPYDGSSSEGIHIIKNQESLTTEILNNPKLLFMEYISKQEYKEFSVDMYYGKDCQLKGIVPRERIKVRAGEINKGITRKNHIVDFLRERMDNLQGVHGCICMQLFYRESDKDIKAIEINSRFGGGFPLSYYAKANFAEYVIREYIMDEPIQYSDSWLDNTLMLRYDNDLIVYDAET